MLVRIVIVSLVLQAACYAPQRPGAERTTYAAMATADGAIGGALVGGYGCVYFTGDFLAPRRHTPELAVVCSLVGAATGGASALAGTLTSDSEPDRGMWLAVGLPLVTVLAATITVLLDPHGRW